MAARQPISDLYEKLACPLCLEFFKDPVAIAECGHSFCRACLTRSWGDPGAEPSCPQCRGKAQPRSLRPNQQLANFVEIAKKCCPQGGEEEEGEEEEGVCEQHQEPLDLFCQDDESLVCVVCDRSREHSGHQVIPLEEVFPEIQGQTVIKVEEERRVCEKHREPLKLFCEDDDVPICVVCSRSKDHGDHVMVPFEEAAQDYKDQICSDLKILKKNEGKLLTHKFQAIRESLDMLKTIKAEKEKAVAEFQQLHQVLGQQEKLLLAWVEETEKEIVRNKEEYLATLLEELSSLQGHIREMEEKCLQTDNELLQDTRRSLQSYEMKYGYPEAFPAELRWRILEFRDLHPFLESAMKQFKGTLISGPQKPKAANVTLDPDTACRSLILSEDRKSVRLGNEAQALPDNPERFDSFSGVLGREGFTSGHHFWEVTVGSEEGWAVGIARNSVKRKGHLSVDPWCGIWAVENCGGVCRAPTGPWEFSWFSGVEPKRIRVCLNYDKGQVAFFNADTTAPIYTFSEASFERETLFPFFQICSKAGLHLSF